MDSTVAIQRGWWNSPTKWQRKWQGGNTDWGLGDEGTQRVALVVRTKIKPKIWIWHTPNIKIILNTTISFCFERREQSPVDVPTPWKLGCNLPAKRVEFTKGEDNLWYIGTTTTNSLIPTEVEDVSIQNSFVLLLETVLGQWLKSSGWNLCIIYVPTLSCTGALCYQCWSLSIFCLIIFLTDWLASLVSFIPLTLRFQRKWKSKVLFLQAGQCLP